MKFERVSGAHNTGYKVDIRHLIASVVIKHIGFALAFVFVPGPTVVAGQVTGDDAPRVAGTLTLNPCRETDQRERERASARVRTRKEDLMFIMFQKIRKARKTGSKLLMRRCCFQDRMSWRVKQGFKTTAAMGLPSHS